MLCQFFQPFESKVWLTGMKQERKRRRSEVIDPSLLQDRRTDKC